MVNEQIDSPFSFDNDKNQLSDVAQSQQDSVFALLTDMFGDVASSDIIGNVCVLNKWQVNACIEQLIKHAERNNEQCKKGEDLKDQGSDTIIVDTDSKQNETITEQINFQQNENTNCDIVDMDLDIYVSEDSAKCETEEYSETKALQGAIPKSTNLPATSEDLNSVPKPTIDFTNILKQGFKEFVFKPKVSNSRKREAVDTQELESILDSIIVGHKIMILMRGVPGCGKSYLSRYIINRTVQGDYRNHIFSTDDYFYNINDQYVYNHDKLQDAHEFNQKRVRKRAAEGWSPIIVDNTNIKVWEMFVYAKAAIRYGYVVQILQPNNLWSNCASKLAYKNTHGVPKEKIVKMLQNFEPISAEELLKIVKDKYTSAIPQLRHHPPLPVNIICEDTKLDIGNNDQNPAEVLKNENQEKQDHAELSRSPHWIAYTDSCSNTTNVEIQETPKPPREIPNTKIRNCQVSYDSDDVLCSTSNTMSTDCPDWKSYDEESSDFWNAAKTSAMKQFHNVALSQRSPRVKTDHQKPKGNICSILQEQLAAKQPEKMSADIKLTRHKLGCKNESKSFLMMRQIYPNKYPDALWDLYEKCNGDADWAIDILLKDDSCVDNEEASGCNKAEYFKCNCDDIEPSEHVPSSDVERNANIYKDSFKLPRLKNKREKIPSYQLDIKRATEKLFILGDEHYSSHTKKIRDLRHGVETDVKLSDQLEPEDIESPKKKDTLKIEEKEENRANESEDDSSEIEEDEMLEINLGKDLIGQLEATFGVETEMKHSIVQLKTNIFMPKTLAKQLYALWMESVYNQMEEHKHTTMKEDQNFARLLQDSNSFTKYSKTSTDYREVLDMELAWRIYKADQEDWKNSSAPKDLASYLTQLKLFEIFPNVDRDTLLEILIAHKHNFADTVEVLKHSMKSDFDQNLVSKEIELFEKARTECAKKILGIDERRVSPSRSDAGSICEKKSLAPEESKRIALREFEECRNMAVHHSQLKAECYLKAKEAIQKSSTEVAVYYSQIANLHKDKIDIYNHKAANCIMEVHDLTQNNPDIIDLHYLHVMEAIECLDLFVDKHITKLKNLCRSYKYIFIITGRGLHSAGGVSTIKNNVKGRLKERCLKWSEVNPGLLKVKIFSASRYSQNL